MDEYNQNYSNIEIFYYSENETIYHIFQDLSGAEAKAKIQEVETKLNAGN